MRKPSGLLCNGLAVGTTVCITCTDNKQCQNRAPLISRPVDAVVMQVFFDV
jgi:hypothetical protein